MPEAPRWRRLAIRVTARAVAASPGVKEWPSPTTRQNGDAMKILTTGRFLLGLGAAALAAVAGGSLLHAEVTRSAALAGALDGSGDGVHGGFRHGLLAGILRD